MRKILLALTGLLAFVYPAYAQDYSLSASGWVNGPSGTTTYTGTQTINAGGTNWAISPYTGSTMVGLVPTDPTASFNTMTSALGMSAASSSALAAEIAAQNPSGGGTITNGAWISKDFTFAAPTTFSMYWVYTSTDYVPFNDGSITTLVNTGDAATLGKINGLLKEYLLLGATNPGTGNYSTGSYGSTGWQIVNYQIMTAGTYKLGFAAFNQGDTALSPMLYVNDGLGTVTKNGQPFNSVAPNDPSMPDSSGGGGGGSPTVVSTTPTDPTVTSSTSYGTPTVANLITMASTNTGSLFNLTKTTTPVTATPYTTTTISTPKVIQTWSDNTTTTIDDPNNTATTTTQTGTAYQTGASSAQTASASSAALRDAIAYRNFNPFIVDALSIKDGSWARPMIGYVRMENGRYRMKGMSFGYQKTIDNNTFGIAGSFQDTNSAGYLNSKSDNEAYAGTAYILTRQDYAWIKASVGIMDSNYTTNTTISSFNLSNSNKIKQRNTYADVTVYSPVDFAGFRPLFGATVVNSNLSSKEEWGSPLLSAMPNYKSKTEVRPYAGVRYEVGDGFSVEARGTQSKDFKNVVQVRGIYEKNVSEYVKVHVSAGVDKGSNMTGLVGMVGLTVRF
jgi:hypothetical protein